MLTNYPRNESDKQKKTLKKGEYLAMDNGKTLVVAWKDKKIVRTITTMHSAEMKETSIRRKKSDGTFENVWKPAAVVDYNKYVCLSVCLSVCLCKRTLSKKNENVTFFNISMMGH